jgi:hypothetical protein
MILSGNSDHGPYTVREFARQPRRGHHIIEALWFCLKIVGAGFFLALVIQLIYGAVVLVRGN